MMKLQGHIIYYRLQYLHPKPFKQANKRYKRRTTKREMLTSSVNDQKAASHGRNESVPDSNKTMTILDLVSASMLRLSLTANSRKTVAVVDSRRSN